jgi:hypothetical protein
MRKQAKWRRVFVAALIGMGVALVGAGVVHAAGDGAWTADGAWTLSVKAPADGGWTADGAWTAARVSADGGWTPSATVMSAASDGAWTV